MNFVLHSQVSGRDALLEQSCERKPDNSTGQDIEDTQHESRLVPQRKASERRLQTQQCLQRAFGSLDLQSHHPRRPFRRQWHLLVPSCQYKRRMPHEGTTPVEIA